MAAINDCLKIKTYPVANKENILFWQNYRITVLDECLFRVENNEEKIFRDIPTQSVWYRNHPKVSYTYSLNDKFILIKTDKCQLKILNDGEIKVKIADKFINVDNKGNLGGTYRTLDKCDGDTLYDDPFLWKDRFKTLILNDGIISKSGVAYFDDANSLGIGENGMINGEKGLGSDKYIFAYGNHYQEALNALFSLTGGIPMVPRYVFGNWWSRYHEYTDKEYLAILNKFIDDDIPFTIATIDMDWHYSKNVDQEFKITESNKNTAFYGPCNGWTGYSWNKNLFPDYKGFLNKIHDKGYKITLNLHPADGVRFFEDQYQEMAKALNLNPNTEEQIKFDIASPEYINAYFKILHHPYEKDGVDFWWIDWQQGTKSKIDGLDPLWSLNHYHYLDHAQRNNIPLILSRYSGIGCHRYPLGFSGDSFVTWKTLNYLPYFTATASNIGYTYWSHDIGGHMLGYKDDELFVRFVQFGVFSPINRLHNTSYETMSKEPWFYKNGSGQIVIKYLRIRHKLIPFIYNHSYLSHKYGIPLIKPLYYDFTNPICYKYKNEYIFGNNLLVNPITKSKGNKYYSSIKTFIPKGTWTDFFTNEVYSYNQDKEVKLYRPLDEIPVLVKEGSIIPLSDDKGNKSSNPEHLLVYVYNGNNTYSLYEDKDNYKGWTCFSIEDNDVDKLKLNIQFTGDKQVLPLNREMKIVFKNINNGDGRLYSNGQLETMKEYESDNLTYIIDFDPNKTYSLEINYVKESPLDLLKKHALRILLECEDNNDLKYWIYCAINKATTIEEIEKIVFDSPLDKEIKEAIFER